MPDWLTGSLGADAQADWGQLVLRQCLAFVYGTLVALVYRWIRGPQSNGQTFLATLVLLTLLIAVVSAVIGDNVARAFSLVGALSIVRFRTIVEDTRDTAFVILAVGVGMAVGAGHYGVPLVVIPLAGLAARLFGGSVRGSSDGSCEVTVRSTLATTEAVLRQSLERSATRVRAKGVSTARQGAMLESVFLVRLKEGASVRTVIEDLTLIEGVASVEAHLEP